MEEITLLFRHLPAELSRDERKDMLFHFGAIRVRVMGLNGPMKNTAFAVFPSKDHASEIVHQLHQTEVLGSKLIVEFANSKSYTPSIEDVELKKHDGKKEALSGGMFANGKIETEKREIKFDVSYATWGVKHPRRPQLKYRYPPPSPTILTNIMNALAAVPKFYVQVLHLMNKMDLPAPFGTITPAPPLRPDLPVYCQSDEVGQREMDISSSEESESELESDGEDKAQRVGVAENEVHPEFSHRKVSNKKFAKSKKRRLSEFKQRDNVSSTTISVMPALPVQEVFEQMPDSTQMPKKIALNISKPSVLQGKDNDDRRFQGEGDTRLSQSSYSHLLSQQLKRDSTISHLSSSLSTSTGTVISPSMIASTVHTGVNVYSEESSNFQCAQAQNQHHLQHLQQQQQWQQHQLHQPPLPPHHPAFYPQPLPSSQTKTIQNVNRRPSDQIHSEDKSETAIQSELYSPSMNEIEDEHVNTTGDSHPVGFGVLHSTKEHEKLTETAKEDSSIRRFGKQKFISMSALKHDRLSEKEMKDSSVFRRYDPGEVSCRLYIKNVSRQAMEEDLHFIYGRYVDWDSETEVNMFDIRLMNKGRMKGQAFVNLPSETVAKDALSDTNGFLLKDKPLVVQFARSAKAQEDAAAVKS